MSAFICDRCGDHLKIEQSMVNTFFCRCPSCGTLQTVTVPEMEGHSREATVYMEQAYAMLKNKKFKDADECFDKVTRLFPQSSGAYWGKLLAQEHCTDNAELVSDKKVQSYLDEFTRYVPDIFSITVQPLIEHLKDKWGDNFYYSCNFALEQEEETYQNFFRIVSEKLAQCLKQKQEEEKKELTKALKQKRNILPFCIATVSFIPFIFAFFSVISKSADIFFGGTSYPIGVQITIYVCEILSILCVLITLYRASDRLSVCIFLSILACVVNYLSAIIVINNSLNIILKFLTNILVWILGEHEPLLLPGSGLYALAISALLNYIAIGVCMLVLAGQRKHIKQRMRNI